MKIAERRVLVCDCEGTMPIDGIALAKACGDADRLEVANHLCRAQLGALDAAARDGAPLLVACTQEMPVFAESLAGFGDAPPDVSFVNIRENAGWCEAGRRHAPRDLTAKMAALIAEAALYIEGAPAVTMKSGGSLMVLGRDEAALDAAREIAGKLDVTVLLSPDAEVQVPRMADVPVFFGRVSAATGHLGAFEVTIADFQGVRPSSRQSLDPEGLPQRTTTNCDLILDLSGGHPLFTGHEKRDGYYRPDPGNPAQVMKALLGLIDMVGTFEKPRYVDYDKSICAHARSRITGCSRCLDVCPTGAIAPDENAVRYDPFVCAGCGLCATVCPTGAARYALPAGDTVFRRARTLIGTYLKAGGARPVLLVHDAAHGRDMIDIVARLGRGLPPNVLPFAVNQATQIGLDFLFAAQAFGAERTLVLLPSGKDDERPPLDEQVGYASAVLEGLGYGATRIAVLDDIDPDAFANRLYALEPLPPTTPGDFLPVGRKRTVMHLALDHLHRHAPTPVGEIALPKGAPFGTIHVDVKGCTLCLSCVGACPAGALKDNPDRPQLSFLEAACVQCGLCRNTCPEKVISLTARLNFMEESSRPRVLNEEEPFHCVRCGKAFATQASLERMLSKLKGHVMFEGEKLERLKMCPDCRVAAMSEEKGNPFSLGTVPVTRTTADYLRAREEKQARAQTEGRTLTDEELEMLDDEPNRGGGHGA